ncbi:hypothetical protein PROFUN_15340 [Planoprotostelium fungivorum]|uniref:Uncharacterized protein n=1 Tax=Planoprotostelium fungivorum TaxID=1890364 RepID=A0A2P6MWU5_9EUKA|nr:hypothetical protein PROFUN_15340 [Planoprotostelium fungivorum]
MKKIDLAEPSRSLVSDVELGPEESCVFILLELWFMLLCPRRKPRSMSLSMRLHQWPFKSWVSLPQRRNLLSPTSLKKSKRLSYATGPNCSLTNFLASLKEIRGVYGVDYLRVEYCFISLVWWQAGRIAFHTRNFELRVNAEFSMVYFGQNMGLTLIMVCAGVQQFPSSLYKACFEHMKADK